MNSICIDTSLGFCSVAIKKDKEIFYSISKDKSNQSEEIFPIIDKLLKEANLKISDIDNAFCSIGPGSFTGIRIGIAAVRGLAIAHKSLNLYGVSNMQLLASQSQLKNKLVILNAYREQVYIQKFIDMEPVSKIELLDIHEIDFGKEEIIADKSLEEIISKKISYGNINAKIMADYVENKEDYDNFDVCAPLYVRPPDAKPPKRMFDL